MARQFGATSEVLEHLDDPEACGLPESERAALRLAETLTRGARSMGEAGVGELRCFWSEEQIVEMACVVGLFNYLNRFADGLGIHPTQPGEGGPDDREGTTT